MSVYKQGLISKNLNLKSKYLEKKTDLDTIIKELFAITAFKIDVSDKNKIDIAYEKYKQTPYVKKSPFSNNRNEGERSRSILLNVLTEMLSEYGIESNELFDWDYDFDRGVFTYQYAR